MDHNPSLASLASRLGCRSFARAAGEDELGPELPELSELILEGLDEEAAALVQARPELAMARGQTVTRGGPDGFSVIEPLAVKAAHHCCFETAKAMLLAGFNPALADVSGHNALIAACVGVGVQSHRRLLDRRSPEEWAARRMAFLDWLWEREADFGLHAQGLSARYATYSISTPHCRVVFPRCLSAGSLFEALSERETLSLFAACDLPLSRSKALWLQQGLLEDLATRSGERDAGYLACVDALAQFCSLDEIRAAAKAAVAKGVPGASAVVSLAERAELARAHASSPLTRQAPRRV